MTDHVTSVKRISLGIADRAIVRKHYVERFCPIYPFGDDLMADHRKAVSVAGIAEKIICGRAVGFVCLWHDPIDFKPAMPDIEILWKLSKDAKKDVFYIPNMDNRIFLVKYEDVLSEEIRYRSTWHEDPLVRQVQYAFAAQYSAVGLMSGKGLQNIYSFKRQLTGKNITIKRLLFYENPVKHNVLELVSSRNPLITPPEVVDAFFKCAKLPPSLKKC